MIKFNLEQRDLIIGGMTMLAGIVLAFFQPVAGALVGALGGILLQLHLEPSGKKKTKKKKDPIA